MKQTADNQTQEAPRREIIGFANGKYNSMTRELDNVLYFANNTIIGKMQILGLPVTLESVLKYCKDPEAMMSDRITMAIEANRIPGQTKLLEDVLREKAREEIEELTEIPSGSASTKYSHLLQLNPVELDPEEEQDEETPRRELTYSREAVRNECQIYLTDPAQLEAFDRYHAALKAMNEFFKGKAPDAWSGLREYFWLDNKGNVVAAENINFSRFI